MFKKEITKILKKLTGLKKIQLEIPPDQKMGDFAFPCFVLSKTLKKSPNEITKDLITQIKPNKLMKEVKAIGPYLNFFINQKMLVESVLKSIIKEKNNYGRNNIPKKTILVDLLPIDKPFLRKNFKAF